jgi:hypothetical protein
MEQRRFGDSDLVCSALGFGTWEMSTTQYGAIDVQQASAAVGLAIDSGITLFDTAEIYGPYHSEELLGQALGDRRKETVLVTKVGFDIDEAGHSSGRSSRPDLLIAHAESCLRRLNTDWIDLLLIHWPDPTVPYEDSIGALEQLKAAGKIRLWRVNYNRDGRAVRPGHWRQKCATHVRPPHGEERSVGYLQTHGIGPFGTARGFGLLGGASSRPRPPSPQTTGVSRGGTVFAGWFETRRCSSRTAEWSSNGSRGEARICTRTMANWASLGVENRRVFRNGAGHAPRRRAGENVAPSIGA